jgi:glutaminyl-peptide cyclotransferase
MLLLLGAVALAAGVVGEAGDEPARPVAPTAVAVTPTATPSSATARSHRFDGARALGLARLQVEVGQRPAGSPRLQALAKRLALRLPGGRLEPVEGHPGLSNVVGALPGRAPAILLGAHYDTETNPKGFVGANDSAAGTAVLLEVARALARAPRPKNARAVRFVAFDGEEEPAPTQDFYRDALRGSKAYVAAHEGEVSRMILLDYVGNKGLRLPREGSSDVALWGRLRAAAKRVGVVSFFPAGTGVTILDDHTPFLRAGVPSIDLIDFDYRYADTLQDTLDKLTTLSLDPVGEAVVQLLLAERRR